MCGIIGYKGNEQAPGIIMEGLKKLEYRGYDSWGLALKARDIIIIKKVGKISSYNEKIKEKSNCGIGHIRWATHGRVSEENAHPHCCCKGNIAVVHNGIIENYKELKQKLKGHKFVSDTDSEVIPHLIEEYQEKGLRFEEAFRKALSELKGEYAIIAINKNSEEMLASKKAKPLVVGIKEQGLFIASDSLAFLGHTNKALFPEEDDIIIANEGITIKDKEGKIVTRAVEKLDLSIENADKGNFPHFMLKEIYEQPEVLKKTAQINKEDINKFAKEVKKSEQVILLGCGSAYHAALTGMYQFAKISNKNTTAALASEISHYLPFIDEKTLIIPISQSGETADLLHAVRLAKNKGARIFSIVNTARSTLARESDSFIQTKAGIEIAVASTKAYTAQIALLTLISYALANKLGEGIKIIDNAAKQSGIMLNNANQKNISELAKIIKNAKNIYVLGKGDCFPLALETALKIKEISYIHAEGLAAAELKHGPLALIEDKTPCLAFTEDELVINSASEAKSRGAFTIGIGSQEGPFDHFIRLPKSKSPFLISLLPAQLLAYYLALEKGCDIDKPRNLAKSVTVR